VITYAEKSNLIHGLQLIDQLIFEWSKTHQVQAEKKTNDDINEYLGHCVLWVIKEVNHTDKCYSSVYKNVVVMEYAVMASSKVFKQYTVLHIKNGLFLFCHSILSLGFVIQNK
jgi:Iap family predicted aminopeptidase